MITTRNEFETVPAFTNVAGMSNGAQWQYNIWKMDGAFMPTGETEHDLVEVE